MAWNQHVRAPVLHVISLTQYAEAYSCGYCSNLHQTEILFLQAFEWLGHLQWQLRHFSDANGKYVCRLSQVP